MAPNEYKAPAGEWVYTSVGKAIALAAEIQNMVHLIFPRDGGDIRITVSPGSEQEDICRIYTLTKQLREIGDMEKPTQRCLPHIQSTKAR